MDRPTVMVSSTFYDLQQIRTDLAEFIGQLGLDPLLSELPSFPIDPDSDTIENCRTRVEKHADILVLVIGGRYGSVDTATDTSITNLEYIEARKKGIPVYAFVQKDVLSKMDVWTDNNDADFSSAVDTTRVFEFITQVRSEHKVWTVPFESASDIITQLRTQFAYLFLEALQAKGKLSSGDVPVWHESLSADALRLVLEKPAHWEHRLFFQVWCDGVSERRSMLLDYAAGVVTQPSETVRADSASDWFLTRIGELENYTTSASCLVESRAREAFGAEGEPGDDEDIVRTARKLCELLDSYVEWTKRIRRAYLSAVFEDAAVAMGRLSEHIIERLQHFPQEALAKVNAVLSASHARGELPLTLKFELSDMAGFEEAFGEAQRCYLSGSF